MWKTSSLFFFLWSSLAALSPVIVLLGPPGSGKGTCSQFFKEGYGYNHISAGDLVRREIELQTPLGLQVEAAVRRGDFIDRDTMHALITSRIREEQLPLIIDGFVRCEEDAYFLSALLGELQLLPSAFVLLLDADDALCQQRIEKRLVCPQCGHVAAKPETSCSFCQGALAPRLNDTPAVIIKRLRDYRERVEPSYEVALALFPNLRMKTPDDLQVYERLHTALTAFEGDAAAFCANCIP